MSNRRKLQPPPNVARYAAAYRCTDCTGRAGKIWRDHAGVWHVAIQHDDGCPVLTGRVSPAAADVAAVDRAGIDRAVVILGVRDDD